MLVAGVARLRLVQTGGRDERRRLAGTLLDAGREVDSRRPRGTLRNGLRGGGGDGAGGGFLAAHSLRCRGDADGAVVLEGVRNLVHGGSAACWRLVRGFGFHRSRHSDASVLQNASYNLQEF